MKYIRLPYSKTYHIACNMRESYKLRNHTIYAAQSLCGITYFTSIKPSTGKLCEHCKKLYIKKHGKDALFLEMI